MNGSDADSPLALWGHAREFLRAADAIVPPPTTAREALALHYDGVAYYLLGHAIELALKAFLRSRGTSARVLARSPFMADLHALRKEASRHKLGREVKLSRAQKTIIEVFSDDYVSKRAHYGERELVSVPRYVELRTIAETLLNGLQRICHRRAAQKTIRLQQPGGR